MCEYVRSVRRLAFQASSAQRSTQDDNSCPPSRDIRGEGEDSDVEGEDSERSEVEGEGSRRRLKEARRRVVRGHMEATKTQKNKGVFDLVRPGWPPTSGYGCAQCLLLVVWPNIELSLSEIQSSAYTRAREQRGVVRESRSRRVRSTLYL